MKLSRGFKTRRKVQIRGVVQNIAKDINKGFN